MSLHDKAIEVSVVVNKILAELGNAASSKDAKGRYASEAYSNLSVLITQYNSAVNIDKNRDSAKKILLEMKAIIEHVGLLSVKADMDILNDFNSDLFFDLSTIFQETQFRDEELQ